MSNARNILKKCLNLQRKESVLVITDDQFFVDYFSKESKQIGSQFTSIFLPKKQRPYSKLPDNIRVSISSSDVILTPFARLSGEKRFREGIINLITKDSARLGHMPGVTRDILLNCIAKTDVSYVKKMSELLAGVLTRAATARLTTEKGTDIQMKLGGWSRPADTDYGMITAPGSWDNLPAGEACIAPIEGSANGRVIIDGSALGKLIQNKSEEIELSFAEGLVEVSGGKLADSLDAYLRRLDKQAPREEKSNMYQLAELGIGCNPAARLTGNIIEDEKKFGSAHIALGWNQFLGGTLSAADHIDMVILEPCLEVDGIKILERGEFLSKQMHEMCSRNYLSYDSDAIEDDSEVSLVSPRVKCASSAKGLVMWYVGPGGRALPTIVGDPESAKIAQRIYKLLERGNCRVDALSRKIGMDREAIRKILAFMRDFRIVSLESGQHEK